MNSHKWSPGQVYRNFHTWNYKNVKVLWYLIFENISLTIFFCISGDKKALSRAIKRRPMMWMMWRIMSGDIDVWCLMVCRIIPVCCTAVKLMMMMMMVIGAGYCRWKRHCLHSALISAFSSNRCATCCWSLGWILRWNICGACRVTIVWFAVSKALCEGIAGNF